MHMDKLTFDREAYKPNINLGYREVKPGELRLDDARLNRLLRDLEEFNRSHSGELPQGALEDARLRRLFLHARVTDTGIRVKIVRPYREE
jgi:hypothetical protein